MQTNNLPKGIFQLRKTAFPINPEQEVETIDRGSLNENSLLNNDHQTIERMGFKCASEHNATTIGLSICLTESISIIKNLLQKIIISRLN